MHLLRIADLAFEEFSSHGPFPRYAILSHTWITPGDQEVTFREIQLHGHPLAFQEDDIIGIKSKAGWEKIGFTIENARKQSLEYVWIDTCCINKENPTELSEAINCMFNWYKQAAICYAYISDADVSALDVSRGEEVARNRSNASANHFSLRTNAMVLRSGTCLGHLPVFETSGRVMPRKQKRQRVTESSTAAKIEPGPLVQQPFLSDDNIELLLRGCRWMRRGWTLQELIAPPMIHFYDVSWTLITTRSKSAAILSRITGIDEGALRDGVVGTSSDHRLDLHHYSIAQRMCWAVDRQTTRSEDRAYSLLGLFGVIMPLHYGEGEEGAFTRLQEEIIRSSSDQSIFAWACPQHATGLLACEPECFQTRSHVMPRRGTSASRPHGQHRTSASYSMNNRGLDISLPVLSTRLGYIHQAVLNCRSADDPSRVFLLNLYHIENNEFCVIDGHSPRCIDIDWWRLPSSMHTDIFEQQIVIRRSWAEFCRDDEIEWELVLRLEDTVCSSHDQGGLIVHSTHPAKSWLKKRYYYHSHRDPISERFDGAAAVCLSYNSSALPDTTLFVFLAFSHKEVLGKTLLTLQMVQGRPEDIDGLDKACLRGASIQRLDRKEKFVQGYTPLDLGLMMDDSTLFKVVLQEISILGDAVWELKVVRLATNIPHTTPTLSTAYPAIWEEISTPLERLECVPLDDGWIRCLPAGCTVLSTVGCGSSYWSRQGKVEVRLEDGSIKDYFIKLTETSVGKAMSEGEYESMRLLYTVIPETVPKPVGHGSLECQNDTHFFLCEFQHMHDRVPAMRDLCTRIASLHLRSQPYSPNGKFGFHITTYNGTYPQYTKWNASWEKFYIESLKNSFALEQSINGFSQEIEDLLPALYKNVCPRLLRPLETEGRILRPTLVHGDIWDRNTGVSLKTGAPCIFDASALWAHNEYDLHIWRGNNFEMGKEFVHEYFKHFPISAPVEDWEDRHLLYGLMSDLHESFLFRGTDKFRRFLIVNMRSLVDKFPEGYQGRSRCKADEIAAGQE